MGDVLHFQLVAGEGDPRNDLQMNRGEFLTVSITVMEIDQYKSEMQYLDLQNGQTSTQELIFTKAAAIQ